jgi:hypothetical protein
VLPEQISLAAVVIIEFYKQFKCSEQEKAEANHGEVIK